MIAELEYVAVGILAYGIGSVPFALIAARLFGLPDPRTFGSGNPGATNMLRSGHKGAALLTLVGDVGKGTLAVLGASLWLGKESAWVAFAGLAAFLGHLYSPWLCFRGGKGVATALGVLLGIAPWLGVMAALIWLTVAALARYSSLAAIVAAFFTPLLAWLLELETQQIAVISAIALLILLRHRSNIARLLAGTESKIGGKS